MKNGMTTKPRYTRKQKARNAEHVRSRLKETSGFSLRWNSEIHVTLFFDNGRRLELYPTTIGLQSQGHWLRWFDVDAAFSEIQRFSDLPPACEPQEVLE